MACPLACDGHHCNVSIHVGQQLRASNVSTRTWGWGSNSKPQTVLQCIHCKCVWICARYKRIHTQISLEEVEAQMGISGWLRLLEGSKAVGGVGRPVMLLHQHLTKHSHFLKHMLSLKRVCENDKRSAVLDSYSRLYAVWFLLSLMTAACQILWCDPKRPPTDCATSAFFYVTLHNAYLYWVTHKVRSCDVRITVTTRFWLVKWVCVLVEIINPTYSTWNIMWKNLQNASGFRSFI